MAMKPGDAWDQWSALPQEVKERALLRAGLRPPGHPSRRWWQHPVLAFRAARQRRITAKEIEWRP